VPDFSGRVAHARAAGKWPGEPLHVRQQGDEYVLLAGFSRLAVAVEAGLVIVQAVVEPPAQTLPLAVIHLRPWQEQARLNPQKLARRREQARKSGILPEALAVRPARLEELSGYTLVDGLYWFRVAQELGMAEVPVIVHQGEGDEKGEV
jgi:ParB-like chromosome segregation protein Spo0J